MKQLLVQGGHGHLDPAGDAQAGRSRHSVRNDRGRSVRRRGASPGLTLQPTPFSSTHWLVFADQWDAQLSLARPAGPPGRHSRGRPAGGQSGRNSRVLEDHREHHSYQLRFLLAAADLSVRSGEGPASSSRRPVTPRGFDAGDFWCDAGGTSYCESVLNYLQAAGIRTRLRPLERAAFMKAYQEKKLKNIIYGLSGVFGNAATRMEAFHGLERRLRLRRLSRHRRALPRASDRARPEEARGDFAPDPAADPREGHVPADLAALAAPGARPADRRSPGSA